MPEYHNYTAEEIHSKIFYTSKYFKPFNWDSRSPIDYKRYILRNITNNKVFKRNKNFYKLLGEKYPLKENLDSIIYGIFLSSSTPDIYSFDIKEFPKFHRRWVSFKTQLKSKTREDLRVIKEYMRIYQLSFWGLIKYIPNISDHVSHIFYLYKDSRITASTFGVVYLKAFENPKALERFKEWQKKYERSLNSQEFFREVFRWYRLVKLAKSC